MTRRSRHPGAAALLAGALALVAADEAFAQSPPELDGDLRALARAATAPELPEPGRNALAQALRDTRSDRLIVLVASHPDDQYVLPAALFRLRDGHRVVVLLMTRGEGGQNSAGPEVGDALGARRAIETEACARRLGIEIQHLNNSDAGYSRDGDETLELWGREHTVRELAVALRELRPDAVLTTHNPDEPHGHDQALLQVLPDAVELACSPEFDGAPGLPPAPIAVLARGATPDETADIELPVLDVDPDHGATYREFAYRALVETHRSQSPFRPEPSFFGEAHRLVLLRGPTPQPPGGLRLPVPDLFDRLAQLRPGPRANQLRNALEAELPSAADQVELARRALNVLHGLATAVADLESDHDVRTRFGRRREALERVLRHALGIRVEASCEGREIAVPGDTLLLTLHCRDRCPDSLPIDGLRFEPFDMRTELRSLTDWRRAEAGGREARFAWQVADDALGDHPLHDLFRRRRFVMPLGGHLLIALRDATSDTTVQIDLPIELPCSVQPAIELLAVPNIVLLADGRQSALFNVRVRRNGDGPVQGRLRIRVPAGLGVDPGAVDIRMTTERELGLLFDIWSGSNMRPGPSGLSVELGRARRRIEIYRVPVTVPAELRVGLIEGVDDASREVLRQLGCEMISLTERELPTRKLDDLHTILIDIRALRHHAAGRAEFNRLVDFARRGGRLVVLYHKDSEFDFEATGSRFHPAELPLRIGKGRVTREDAPISVLVPDHPLFNHPNQLRPVDWDGWAQERSLYHASEWAAGYTPLIEAHDPGQAQERGILLHAKVGDGEFIYCALALHRQLKTLHPGACRLFANLVTPPGVGGDR